MSATKAQASAILEYLEQGRALTPLEALDYFGCNRLAARIWDLREAGHQIESRSVKTPAGKRVSRYWIQGAAADLYFPEAINA